VHYHLGKANVIADALSHKAHYNYLPVVPLTREELSIRVLPGLSLYNITLTPQLREEIIVAHQNDEGTAHLRRRLLEGDPKVNFFHEDAEGTLWLKDRLAVPMKEALKMYHDLRQQFWWTQMKRETACYVSECDTCRKVKDVYMKPRGLLQQRSIPI
jgi:hypothetical protein